MTPWLVLAIAAAIALVVPVTGYATTPHENDEPTTIPDVPVVTSPFVGPSVGRSSFQADASCSSGAHTLSQPGARVYPEMGNGGYTSDHTDVTMNYDAPTNLFLPGTKVDLTVTSTQCLSDLSFDFERTNGSTAGGTGPDMTVSSVEINGVPAGFAFVQPTYPGDPSGQNDPDPAAHAVSNANPVSATNPNPPACSPQVNNNSQNGLPCPADKLVVTPFVGIPAGTTFTVTINYTGRPGVHVDGDGSTEGWFRVNTSAAPNDGAFVTTEPVGTDSWMPLNNHPSAKPTYDFYDTTNIGKTAIAAGQLVGSTPPTGAVPNTFALSPTSVNPPDANFPTGSWTWHWHEEDPIANYLVENSIGSYDLTARTSPTSGIQYFQAMASGLTAARKATIKTNLDLQEDITEFQKLFNGPWPFTTNGIVVALPSVGFAEEMQTKITFGNGATSTPSVGTINHENMHQWFGDNVSEASFNLTFWKEGFATLGEYFNTARTAAIAAGGLGTPAGDAAFETSLVNRFNGTGNYQTASGTFWTSAPSNPTVGNLFTTAFTYTRPGTSYIALWRALGKDGMVNAMKQIQSEYGGSSITEPQLESVFRDWLPSNSASCNARLDQFFPQWWDTAYPAGGANTVNKPSITGPGLNGTGFVCATVSPATPTGSNGWYTDDVSVTWQGYGAPAVTKTGCEDGTITTDGTFDRSCSVTTTAAPILTSGAVSETIKVDQTAPDFTHAPVTVDATSPGGTNVAYTVAPTDDTSGIASTVCLPLSGTLFAIGDTTVNCTATDVAGNSTAAHFTVHVRSATEQLGILLAATTGAGPGKALADQVRQIQGDLAQNRKAAACSDLSEFKVMVNGFAGGKKPKITEAQRASFITKAEHIGGTLGC